MKSSTKTLIEAMQILSAEIQSEDGVANSAILEASERLRELESEIQCKDSLIAQLEKIRVRDEIFALEQQAKGLSKYVSDAMDHYWILHLNENISYHNFLIGLNERASKLREQAKQLKGGDL